MKTLQVTISIIALAALSGCAHTGYQRGYTGYGSGYGSGYSVERYYNYPSSTVYHGHYYTPRRYQYDYRHDEHEHRSDRERSHDHREGWGNVERRVERQHDRIREGADRGNLTGHEARVLEHEQERMNRQVERARERPWASQAERRQSAQDSNRSDNHGRESRETNSGGDRGADRRHSSDDNQERRQRRH